MEFRHIEILNVLLDFGSGEIPVGRLATKNGRIYFEYDAGILEMGLQISPYKLPLKKGLIENEDATFDGLFGVFNDSLPDGWGKLLVDRALRTNNIPHESLTPLDRLSFVGKNGMGALQFTPEQHFDVTEQTIIDLDRIATDVGQVLEGSVSEVIEQLQVLGGSSTGARPKIMVGYNKNEDRIISGINELPAGFEHWLIKFPSASDPQDIAESELAYARMATEAGIEMTETKLFHGASGKKYFGTKRFDHINGKRLHMHTAAGLLHSSHRFPTMDYKDLMNSAWNLTQDHREMEKVFRLCCFNVLAHNRDDHSKNFSFLMDENGKWTFAPAYDLTFSYGPGGHQSTMVMGEGAAPDQSHLRKLAAEFDLKHVDQTFREVMDAIHAWPDLAGQAGVSRESINLIGKYLSVV